MNKVFLIGRLTKDPVVKMTPNNISVCSFTVAVDRRFKNQNGERQADFIPCVGWRQVAEIIGNYFSKGSSIGITGSIQTRSYDDQNGQSRFVTEILVEEIDFIDKKKDTAPNNANIVPVPEVPKNAPKVEPLAESDDDDISGLPFDVCGY